MPDPDRLIALGIFGAPRGVRGETRVKAYTSDPLSIGAYGALTDAVGARRFVLEALRPLKYDMLVARVAGVTSRESALALTGVELFARRGQLPPPAEDEYYYDDLVGLRAIGLDGVPFGRVAAVTEFGAGDILEIAPESGGETLLLPFTKAVAPRIDFAAGLIVIAPPRELDGERESRSSAQTAS